jgi:tetratricopeptide (TPR) repeat protein
MRAVLVLVLLLGAVAHADEEPEKARGKAIWNEGVTLYNLGEFDEAIKKFEDAYRVYANPNILFNLGQAHRQKKDYDAAIFNFRAYLRLKPQATNRGVVEELITELEGLIAAQQQSGQKPPVNVEQPPPPAPPPAPPVEPRRWYEDQIGWGLAGVGLVAAGVGVALLVHGGSQASDAQATTDQQQAIDLNESARSSRRIGGIVAGVGAALIAGGVVKMVLYERDGGPRVAVAVAPGGIGLAGRF